MSISNQLELPAAREERELAELIAAVLPEVTRDEALRIAEAILGNIAAARRDAMVRSRPERKKARAEEMVLMWNKLPQEKRKRDPVPYEDFPNPHKGGRPAGPVLGLPQKRYGKGRRAKSSEERTENAPLIVLSAPVLARCIVNAFNPHRPKGKAWVALCLTVLEHYEGPWGPSVYPSFEGFGGFEALDPEDKSAWEKHRMGQAIRAARETPEKRAARMTRVWRKQQKAAREERARSSATR